MRLEDATLMLVAVASSRRCTVVSCLSEGATTFGPPGYKDGVLQTLYHPHKILLNHVLHRTLKTPCSLCLCVKQTGGMNRCSLFIINYSLLINTVSVLKKMRELRNNNIKKNKKILGVRLQNHVFFVSLQK